MKPYILTETRIKSVREKTEITLSEKVSMSSDAARILRLLFDHVGEDIGIRECFFALYLNRANRVVSFSQISSGGVSGTVVDPRLVFKGAIDCLASGIILCHNHPSGNLNPSVPDRELTEKIKKGASLFDMSVIDHIILTEDKYLSFADENFI